MHFCRDPLLTYAAVLVRAPSSGMLVPWPTRAGEYWRVWGGGMTGWGVWESAWGCDTSEQRALSWSGVGSDQNIVLLTAAQCV